MQNTDIILVNVVGTNGETRQQRTITRRFNGAGYELNDKGAVESGVAVLKGLPLGTSKAPDFPQDEYLKAQAANDGAKISAIMLAHAERVEAWQKSQGGGSEEMQLAKIVQDYCVEVHDFTRQDDGPKFVLTLDDIDVKSDELKDGRTLYTVSGTAVFGA